MDNKVDVDTLIFEKITNFKEYIENNLIKYVSEEQMENAIFNLNLITTIPYFMIKGGMKSLFKPERTNKDIIDEICNDYFIDYNLMKESEMEKIYLYCDFFKKYLYV